MSIGVAGKSTKSKEKEKERQIKKMKEKVEESALIIASRNDAQDEGNKEVREGARRIVRRAALRVARY